MNIEISKVLRSKRRTLALEILHDARLVVRSPFKLADTAIYEFVQKKRDWIVRTQEKIKKRNLERPYQQLNAVDKDTAGKMISERVELYSSMTGLTYSSIKITGARSRWGSCSRNGRLTFSYRLAMAPAEVIDYVVVHELMHLAEMNHSERFWDRVGAVLPEYKIQKTWLKENSHLLAA